MMPFVQLLADIKTTGLGLVLISLILSMLPVSAWFWLRLALYGEVDLVQTSGGTSFLLARVTPNHLQAVSFLMVALCLIMCVIPIFSSLCLCLVLFLDWVERRPPEWRLAQTGRPPKERCLMRSRMTTMDNDTQEEFHHKW